MYFSMYNRIQYNILVKKISQGFGWPIWKTPQNFFFFLAIVNLTRTGCDVPGENTKEYSRKNNPTLLPRICFHCPMPQHCEITTGVYSASLLGGHPNLHENFQHQVMPIIHHDPESLLYSFICFSFLKFYLFIFCVFWKYLKWARIKGKIK